MLDWFASSLELMKMVAIAKKNRVGFVVGFMSCIAWLLYVFLTKSAYGILLVIIPAMGLNVWGYISWGKTKKKPEKPIQDMNDYQDQAFHHAFYPDKGNNLTYVLLGLNEEAGEAAGKVKKMLRDKAGVMDEETKQLLVKELGDTLWYLACTAREIDMSLSEVAQANVAKLASRRSRGTLRGSGDNR